MQRKEGRWPFLMLEVKIKLSIIHFDGRKNVRWGLPFYPVNPYSVSWPFDVCIIFL